jgi:hypothetical protein
LREAKFFLNQGKTVQKRYQVAGEMAQALQYNQTAQRFGIPPTGARNLDPFPFTRTT